MDKNLKNINNKLGGAILKKPRNSNLELYRIIVMLSIVASHYVHNSGLMQVLEQEPLSARSFYYYLFGAWGKVGINCFVLITGYFMCRSQITLEKFLKLMLEVYFYRILIHVIFFATGYEPVTLKGLFLVVMPVSSVKTNFTSCFLLFFLSIPFLNILVRNMTKQQHLWLLCLFLGIYTGLGTLFGGQIRFNYVTWFCILYFISSYIRLYKPLQNVRWGIATVGAFFLSIASIVAILYLSSMKGNHYPQYYFIMDSNKVLALVLGVSLFMWLKDIKVQQSKLINRIAESCFGVLLIHAHSDTMRQWLWKDVLNVAGQYHSENFILHSIVSVLGIYIVCTLIDQMRIMWIERPLLKWLEHNQLLYKWLNRIK